MDEKVQKIHKMYVKAEEQYIASKATYAADSMILMRRKDRLDTLTEVMKILDLENQLDI